MALISPVVSPRASRSARGPVAGGATWLGVAYGALAAAGLLALFLLSRPYEGILHDARLYIGYALAALHPDSIGHDMVLAEHGQSGFTIFPALMVFMVTAFGSSLAAKLTALAALVLWFGAAAALSASIAEGRTRWVILIFIAVLPAHYAGLEVFHYAEALAVPRPFAEAFVLLGLALFGFGWRFWAALPLVIAGLIHPIMAVPGLAIYAWLLFFDPQTRVVKPIVGLACVGIGLACLVGAAALGVPVADRLFAAVDPAWRDILLARSPYLFVSEWPLADWTRTIVQLATVAIAARLVSGRVRSLFAAVALVAVAGVLTSLLFGDALGSLLVIQIQPWRALWLLAVFAAAGLGVCSVSLWQRGAAARVTLALLVLAWIENQVPPVAIVASALALALVFLPLRPGTDFRRVAVVIWAIVGFCALLYFGTRLYGIVLLALSSPHGAGGELDAASTVNLLAIPVCVLAVLWANARQDTWIVAATTLASVAAVCAALLLWDDRKSWYVATDQFGPDPELAAILATRDGEVLWIGGGFATWSQAGRPNWVSRLQGASNVFSRPLAGIWDARVRAVADLGMVDQRLRNPFSARGRTSGEEPHLAHVSDAALEQLCARPDAPAWVIAPAKVMKDAQLSVRRWSPSYWRAPRPEQWFEWDGKAVNWTATRDYVILRCLP